MILGIDAGNYETKICANNKVHKFLSDIGEYRERKLNDSFGNDDIIWEYDGQKGFAGSLAKFESEFSGTIKGKTKAHQEAILRVLIAVHLYGSLNNSIIVGQPIDSHIDEEKEKIKSKLKGKHIISINGIEKEFNISNIEVAPEGPSALLSNPVNGLIRVIDIGSGTTNFSTLYNLKRIDKDSFTEQLGTEIVINRDPREMTRRIIRIISGTWDISDKIFLTGGGAEKVYPYLKEVLINCKILKPRLGNSLVNTRFANAIGFYLIAKGLYNNEN